MTDDGVQVQDRRRSSERRIRPLAALDAQVSLIKALQDPVYGPSVVRGAKQGVESSDDNLRSMGLVLAAKLNTATTVIVTEKMLDHVLKRMATIPFGDPLVPDDLFFEAAYFVFPRPIVIGTLEEDDLTSIPNREVAFFDGGFYVPQPVLLKESIGKDEEPLDGVLYAQMCSIELVEEHRSHLKRELAAGTATEKTLEEIDNLSVSLQHMRDARIEVLPVYSTGLALGVSWDPKDRDEEFVLTPAGEFERRFWLSLLRTVKEEVFAPVRFKREVYRRMSRRQMVPDVVVADLRRVRHKNQEQHLPTGETILWTHRWRRRGHPRTIHKGTDRERTIWVREHICGPENMPLIEKDRVYRLSR